MKCEKCEGTGHICKISGIDFIGYTAEVSHCPQCKGSGEISAQQSVHPTVLCAGHSEGSFVKDGVCQTCGLPAPHSG